MPRPGRFGRRVWIAAVLATALAVLGAGLAFGAAPIVGRVDNTYSAATYTINQGEVAQLNVTGSTHNVTANGNGPDGKNLFKSPTISGGTVDVNGTQYLAAGDYTFFCSIHPTTMQATLHVTSAGAPVARPTASLTLQTRKISQAVKKGLLVGINTNTKIDDVTVTAKLGNVTVAEAPGLALAAGQQFDVLKLTKAGKNKLAKKKKASISLSATIPFGSPAIGSGKLKK